MAVQHMQLFPLQVVLYPHCTLPLHIFESRYRTMINMCLEHDVPFGVVQIASGLEVGGRAKVHDVGTVAAIQNVTKFADGRFFITTQGTERFRILESAYDGDVLTARVETYADANYATTQEMREYAKDVKRLFDKYWQLLEMVLNKELGRVQLPDDPHVLSWLVPSVLHVEGHLKQAILEKQDTRERLEFEQELLIEEVEKLLEAMREARGGH